MLLFIALSLLTLAVCLSLAVFAGAGRHVPMALWVFPPALGFGAAGRWMAGDIATGVEVTWYVLALGTVWFAGATFLARGVLWVQANAGDAGAVRRNAHHSGVMWASAALSMLGLAGWLLVTDWVRRLAPALSSPPVPHPPASESGLVVWAAGAAAILGLVWFGASVRARRELGGRGLADTSLSLTMLVGVLLLAPAGYNAAMGALTKRGGAALQQEAMAARGVELPVVSGLEGAEIPADVDVLELDASGEVTYTRSDDATVLLVYADRSTSWWLLDPEVRLAARDGRMRIFAMVRPDDQRWPVAVPIPLTARTNRLQLTEARFGGVEIVRGPDLVEPGVLIAQDGAAWVVAVDDGLIWGDIVDALAALRARGVEPQLYLDGLLLDRDYAVR